MILLDTSILIELFRKKDKTKTMFYAIAQESNVLAISAITHYEMGVGNRESHGDYWEELQKQLVVIPFDESCSVAAADIYSDLRKKSKMIDLADLLIGATAVSNKILLAILNTKHFQRIVGLKLY